jgi:hypothetical protein
MSVTKVDSSNIRDNKIVLNSETVGEATLDAKLEVERGILNNSALTWNETDNKWYQDRAGVATVLPTSTSELTEGTNLYFTDERARSAAQSTAVALAIALG